MASFNIQKFNDKVEYHLNFMGKDYDYCQYRCPDGNWDFVPSFSSPVCKDLEDLDLSQELIDILDGVHCDPDSVQSLCLWEEKLIKRKYLQKIHKLEKLIVAAKEPYDIYHAVYHNGISLNGMYNMFVDAMDDWRCKIINERRKKEQEAAQDE